MKNAKFAQLQQKLQEAKNSEQLWALYDEIVEALWLAHDEFELTFNDIASEKFDTSGLTEDDLVVLDEHLKESFRNAYGENLADICDEYGLKKIKKTKKAS